MYLAFTHLPGESYRRRLRSLLLYLCCTFEALINSLVCWFWRLDWLQALSWDAVSMITATTLVGGGVVAALLYWLLKPDPPPRAGVYLMPGNEWSCEEHFSTGQPLTSSQQHRQPCDISYAFNMPKEAVICQTMDPITCILSVLLGCWNTHPDCQRWVLKTHWRQMSQTQTDCVCVHVHACVSVCG